MLTMLRYIFLVMFVKIYTKTLKCHRLPSYNQNNYKILSTKELYNYYETIRKRCFIYTYMLFSFVFVKNVVVDIM